MKHVVIIPQYNSLTFRIIGKFNDEESAREFADDYFQDDCDFDVVLFNKKLHEKDMEDIPQSYGSYEN
jgi:hypothetical protein